MIGTWTPWKFILLGFVMALSAVIIPMLMILQFIPSTFFLNFLSYVLSVTGLVLGFYGMSMLVKIRRKK